MKKLFYCKIYKNLSSELLKAISRNFVICWLINVICFLNKSAFSSPLLSLHCLINNAFVIFNNIVISGYEYIYGSTHFYAVNLLGETYSCTRYFKLVKLLVLVSHEKSALVA